MELKPDYAEAHSNLGVALQDQGKLDEAVACYRRALELKPDYADAHTNRAIARLLAGDWQHGWPEYEWRWRTKEFTPRGFPQPLWDGRSLAGKTILLHAEQGLGDTIQFVRYAPLVKRLGGTVVLECQKPLVPLLATCPGVDRLVGSRRRASGICHPCAAAQPAQNFQDIAGHHPCRRALSVCRPGAD